jgi:hypothetical protein
MVQRRRVKISATLDPELLDGVDAYVRQHPDVDRSKIIDEALYLWLAEQQRQAMIEQYREDDRPPGEVAAWNRIRDAAAGHILGRDRE